MQTARPIRTGGFAIECCVRCSASAAGIDISLLEDRRSGLVVISLMAMMGFGYSTGQQGCCGECVGSLHVSKTRVNDRGGYWQGALKME